MQTIAPIQTGPIDVPGSLVGSDKATVTADEVYSDVRSFSIEPVTGAPLDVVDNQDTYLEVNGERRATLTKASLGMTDASTQALIDDYGSKVTLLKAVKTWIPIGGTVLGLVLIGLGVMSRRGGKSDGARAMDKGTLVGSR